MPIITINYDIKPSPRDVNPKENSPDANNKSTEEATNRAIKFKFRAHEQHRPDWVLNVKMNITKHFTKPKGFRLNFTFSQSSQNA